MVQLELEAQGSHSDSESDATELERTGMSAQKTFLIQLHL